MIRILLEDTNHDIVQIIGAIDFTLIDGQEYLGKTVHILDTSFSVEDILTKGYWKTELRLKPDKPTDFHIWDWDTESWLEDVNSKQNAFESKLKELQAIIRDMQRNNPIQSEDATLSIANFYATDNFRYKLEHPESFGVNGEGGVRFWDADGGEQLVGIGWFDFYNPLVNILKRDKLLDTQLYEARLAILAMVSDPTKTPVDIINYDPGFTLPSYPYN